MKFKVLFVVGIVLASCSSKEQDIKPEKKKDPASQEGGVKYSYKVYQKPDVGWVYQVFRGSKLIIDQQHIPAVPGIQGFESKAKAELAARFVLEKVKGGDERPPVTPEELDSIGAIEWNPESLDLPSKPVPVPPPTEEIVEEEVMEYEEM